MWCLNIANLGLQEATQREMCWSVDTLPGGALICILIGSYPTFPEALKLTRYKIEVHTSENHILFFASFIFFFFILFWKIFHQCTHHYVPLRAFLLRAWNVLLSVIDIFSTPPRRIYSGTMRGPRNASVWPEKWLQLRHRRHPVVFLQYGLPPGGGARAGLPGGRAEDVERPPAQMRR